MQKVIRSKTAANHRLQTIAETQAGFFTAKQAHEAGFSATSHSYHTRNGSWVREFRGIYRLADSPTVLRPQLVRGHLWSMDRAGQAQGAYSHFTALALYLFPEAQLREWHMTVPARFRRSGAMPEGLTLHYGDLRESDIAARNGYQLTSPLRTILDLLYGNVYPRKDLSKALIELAERKLITRAQIKSARIPEATKMQFEELLRLKKREGQGTVDRDQRAVTTLLKAQPTV